MSADLENRPEQAEVERGPHGVTPVQPPAQKRSSLLLIAGLVILIAIVVGVIGVMHRVDASTELEHYTNENSAPPVALSMPVEQKSAQDLVMPGNMQPFTVAPIYARTTGYVKAWYHDIGSHVRKGELLAVIETPELDQQLSQAQADLATARANESLAKVTANRYQDLIGKNAVSQQDTDNAKSALSAREAEVASAEANVHRIQELQSFERITAPFDGVVTQRNLDIGQLITASGGTDTTGANTTATSRPILEVSAIGTLRVFINVPQVHAPDARPGTIATLTLPQFPGRTFKGKLVRTSESVDPTTRTLLAEVDVDNKAGELLPGSYTEVHLHTDSTQPALVVPASAVILDANGLHVATVDKDQVAHIVPVTPGRDMGSTMQILTGLNPNEAVITNPPDSLTDGEKVRVVSSPKRPAPAKSAENE